MDAVDYAIARCRMCNYGKDCFGCPAMGIECFDPGTRASAEKLVSIVEAWAKEHPAKTRQSEFLKLFPNADADAEGVLFIPPCRIDKTLYGTLCRPGCAGCRRDYWLQEVEYWED